MDSVYKNSLIQKESKQTKLITDENPNLILRHIQLSSRYNKLNSNKKLR